MPIDLPPANPMPMMDDNDWHELMQRVIDYFHELNLPNAPPLSEGDALKYAIALELCMHRAFMDMGHIIPRSVKRG